MTTWSPDPQAYSSTWRRVSKCLGPSLRDRCAVADLSREPGALTAAIPAVQKTSRWELKMVLIWQGNVDLGCTHCRFVFGRLLYGELTMTQQETEEEEERETFRYLRPCWLWGDGFPWYTRWHLPAVWLLIAVRRRLRCPWILTIGSTSWLDSLYFPVWVHVENVVLLN